MGFSPQSDSLIPLVGGSAINHRQLPLRGVRFGNLRCSASCRAASTCLGTPPRTPAPGWYPQPGTRPLQTMQHPASSPAEKDLSPTTAHHPQPPEQYAPPAEKSLYRLPDYLGTRAVCPPGASRQRVCPHMLLPHHQLSMLRVRRARRARRSVLCPELRLGVK
jgi:hypothetical protein